MVGTIWSKASMAGAACVLAGVTLGACGGSPATAPQSATTHVAKVTASAPAAEATSQPAPAATTSAPSSAPSAGPQLPGVIYDCTSAPPLGQKSAVEPASITLACADGGLGVTDVVWSTWRARGATGTGRVWAKECKPSCAEDGKILYYPALITLSGAKKTTTDGLLFSLVSVTYKRATPAAPAVHDFPLPMPPLPGVINDCTAAPPLGHQSAVKPVSITLACADNGMGIANLVWSTWTASGATGKGRVWVNDCKPNCANGKFHYYRAAITLSDVKATNKDGLLFSRVSATYNPANPSAPALDEFPLPMPAK